MVDIYRWSEFSIFYFFFVYRIVINYSRWVFSPSRWREQQHCIFKLLNDIYNWFSQQNLGKSSLVDVQWKNRKCIRFISVCHINNSLRFRNASYAFITWKAYLMESQQMFQFLSWYNTTLLLFETWFFVTFIEQYEDI